MIVLTTYADDRFVLGALNAGARGYLTKDASGEEIHHALQQWKNARRSTPPYSITSSRPSPPDGRRSQHALRVQDGCRSWVDPARTRRAHPVAEGLPNGDIAERLAIGEGTVKSHINHLLPKIGA